MQNRRRTYLINKRFQFRFMAWVLFFLLLTSVSVVTFLHIGIWAKALDEFSEESIGNMFQVASRLRDYEVARQSTAVADEPLNEPRLAMVRETELYSRRQREVVKAILERVSLQLAIVTIPLILLIGLITIVLSNRIAGPLFRLSKALDRLSKRDLTVRLKFRKNDRMEALANHFNYAIDQLDFSIAHLKKITQKSQDVQVVKKQIEEELAQYNTSHNA